MTVIRLTGRVARGVWIELDAETGFVGDVDRQGLENFVETMNPRPENILCVHGDESSTDQLSSELYQKYHIRTVAPKNLETFRFA